MFTIVTVKIWTPETKYLHLASLCQPEPLMSTSKANYASLLLAKILDTLLPFAVIAVQ